MAAELVLIRGLPGSGKSTMARVLARVGYVHLEADQFFEDEEGYYHFRAESLPEAHAWCLATAEQAMKDGRMVVVANTFTQLWELQPYFDAAERLGASIRVLEADGKWRSVHGVPGYALAKMRERWEPFASPEAHKDARYMPPARSISALRPVR